MKNRPTSSFLFMAFLGVFSLNINALQSAEQLYTLQPDVTPELAKTGVFAVGVQTLQITNQQQLSVTDYQSFADRTLTIEVWYPAKITTAEPKATYENVTRTHKPFSLQGNSVRNATVRADKTFPLVVLSHGYTGYRTIMFYLAEHLASHGYVVVGIDHTDSTTGEIDFANAPFSGFPSTLVNRARDQQFILDYFTNADSAVAKSINTDKAAVIGYSMGGFGSVNTVGGCYNFTQQGLQAFGFPEPAAKALLPVFNICNAARPEVDSRWKAMVAFAPWGQEQNLHKLDGIKVPSLYIAGDHDDVSGYEQGVKKLFEQSPASDTFMLVYENARHNMAPHPAPKVAYSSDADLGHYYEPAWSSETLNRNNQHMTLAFLDCYVKQQDASCAYLPNRESSTQVKQADGKSTPPWPGFADRWGVGMRFMRKQGPQ